MNPYIMLMRPNVCVLSAIGIIVGSLVTDAINNVLVIPAIIAAFIITAAGNVINDIYDIEIDKINAPHRPLVIGRITEKSVWLYFILLNIIGIAVAFLISMPFFAIALLNSIVLFVYSWKLKPLPLVGNIAVSWLASSTFLAADLITDFSLSLPIITLALISFLGTMAREIFKDIEDVKGDIKRKAKTLPIILGEKSSVLIALLFLWAGVLSLFIPVFKSLFSEFYFLGLVPAVILCIRATLSKSPKRAQQSVKYAMFFVMLGYIMGSVF